jgi:hypothetical protein
MPAEMPYRDGEIFSDQTYYSAASAAFWAFYTASLYSNLTGTHSYISSGTGRNEVKNTPIDTTNKLFIKLEQTFLNQLDNYSQIFDNQNKFLLQEKMKLSTDPLLHCYPDRISLEVTEEGSIFYTIIKNDIIIYLQHFLIDEFDNSDEAIVNVFKGENNLLNYGGTLAEAINHLGTILKSETIILPEFA